MHRALQTILLICLLTACTSPAPTPTSIIPTQTGTSQTTRLIGQWMGAAAKPDGSIASVVLHIGESESSLNIEPMTKTWNLKVEQDGSTIQFSAMGTANDPFEQIEMNGTYSDAKFTGEWDWDGEKSAITFTPIASVDVGKLDKFEGLYRFESGRSLSVIVSPEYNSGELKFFSQTLMLTDLESGALRSLYPLDEYAYAVGSLRVVGAPFAGRIQFITDDQGDVTGLMWWDDLNDLTSAGASGQFATRVTYTSEEITYPSADGTRLAGRLSMPEKQGTLFPAFVMLHGSERGTRDNFGNKTMMHFMLSRGIAILNFDKRGVGDSEGSYQESASSSNLQKLAEDANAGVEYLLSRPEFDPGKIGLIGFSQAGWVIPLAASKSEHISYIVLLSGPVASTAHEGRFSDYTNDGDSVTNYDDASITQQMRDLKPGGFDPVPVISELNQQGLWLWGSVDKSIPVTFSAENLQSMIDSGKGNFMYAIFPKGDHILNESQNGILAEIPYSPGVLYFSALSDWLMKNVFDQ